MTSGGAKPCCAFLALVLAIAIPAQAARTEVWLKASTPEVTVVTPLPAKEATVWATEFAQFAAALRSFFGNSKVKLPALTVVVFARGKDFERYYPLLAPGGKPQELEGFFTRHESWAVAGLSNRVSDQARRVIFHEGVHWFLSTMKTSNPVWLEEGLAEMFSTFRVEKNEAQWGKPVEEHVGLLRAMSLLPLEKLLYTARGDLFGNDSVRTGIVYAESWAFVHLLVFGKHDIPRKAFGDYADALSSGVNPDEAFRRAFGRTYQVMDRLLEDYLHTGAYYVMRQPLAPVGVPTVSPASALEVQNALGRLAFAGHRFPQALEHARAAVAADANDPRGHELLGIVLQAQDDKAGAHAAFEAAIARGSQDFQPYFEAAFTAHQTAVSENENLSPTDARNIANRYERAINLYPRFRVAYENLAAVIGVAEPWGPEDRRFLELGLRLFPDSGNIEIGLAQLLRREGDLENARVRLDRILAARAGLTMEGTQFAHRLSIAWEQEEIGREIDQLGHAGKFSEAIAFVDARLAAGVDITVRRQLGPVREQLVVAEVTQRLQRALEAQDWAVARGVIQELLESKAPAAVKAQARRTLAELDAKRLGAEARPR